MTALGALYDVLYRTLAGDMWDERVRADYIESVKDRPYVIYFLSGGGNELVTRGRRNARLVVTVKVVADTLGDAMVGAERLQSLLDGQGSQEFSGLVGDTVWDVLTVTQSTAVHLVERYEGVQPVYHEGHQYVFIMETK